MWQLNHQSMALGKDGAWNDCLEARAAWSMIVAFFGALFLVFMLDDYWNSVKFGLVAPSWMANADIIVSFVLQVFINVFTRVSQSWSLFSRRSLATAS